MKFLSMKLILTTTVVTAILAASVSAQSSTDHAPLRVRLSPHSGSEQQLRHAQEHEKLKEAKAKVQTAQLIIPELERELANEHARQAVLETFIEQKSKIHDGDHAKKRGRALSQRDATEAQRRHDLEHEEINVAKAKVRASQERSTEVTAILAQEKARLTELAEFIAKTSKVHDDNHAKETPVVRRKLRRPPTPPQRIPTVQSRHDQEHQELDEARAKVIASEKKIAEMQSSIARELAELQELKQFISKTAQIHNQQHQKELQLRSEKTQTISRLEKEANAHRKAAEELRQQIDRLRNN